MNLMLTIKNLENKKQLKKIIEEKTLKLNKYLQSNIKISWNYFTESSQHLSEVRVSGFKGPVIKATAKSENMYEVIDLALNKITNQLRKRNDKLKTKKARNYYKEIEQE